jgi:hypothetical protein
VNKINTTYFLNLVAGNVFRTKTTPAIPAQYWIGLSTTAPNINSGGVTEPSLIGTGYARVLLTSLSEPLNGVVTNEATVSFPESLTAWSTPLQPITHFVIYDAQTNGNLLMYDTLTLSRAVEQNTVVTVRPGELEIALENPAP